MSNRTRVFFLLFTVVAMLLVSAVGTTSVYADDGAPVDEGPVITQPPDAGTTDTEGEPVVTEPPDAGTTDTEGEPVVTEPPDAGTTDTEDTSGEGEAVVPAESSEADTTGTESASDEVAPVVEEQSPAEVEAGSEALLEQVPDNTTVTVLDAEGEAQPLASQESADAILISDPIWCPAGQSPTPGENGCTQSYSSFTELLDFLKANEGDAAYQQAGTIYVQQGAYLGGEASVDFNSYGFSSLNNYNLTVHGGWDTVDNSIDPTDTSQFNIPIIIGTSTNPWVGSLTFNNLVISNVSGQTGLTLYSQGDITLSNVVVTDSRSGARLHAGGNVSVSNSEFSNNGSGVIHDPVGYGLDVTSGGGVSLTAVTANSNQLFGANIVANNDVTVTNSFFNGNQSYTFLTLGWEYHGYGLQVITTQDITLTGVNANNNYVFGAHLDGANVDVLNSFFNDNATDSIEDNHGSGLEIDSTAAVTLTGIEANNNHLFGADIQAVGTVVVVDGFFNGNHSYEYSSTGEKTYYGYGLNVVTDGVIVLDSVTASENYLFGAHLEGAGTPISNSTFSNNGSGSGLSGYYDLVGRGLEVISSGIVTLDNVTASNNQLFGADIQAVGNVTITGSFFSGHKVYVYDSFRKVTSLSGGGYGLRVVTDGTVALNDVEAINNYLYGAHLEGSAVEITGGVFSNNGSDSDDQPVGFGLEIISTGTVTLAGVTANNNQLFGTNIQAGANVTVANSFFNGHQSHAFDPVKNEGNFYGYGLTVVTTSGVIALDGVDASFNNLWGASLTGRDENNLEIKINVNIANSTFNNNVSDSSIFIDDTGLIVDATGDVNLDNVEANENRLIGAVINADGNVSINNSRFSGNQGITCLQAWCPPGSQVYHGYGLSVTAGGLIELNEVTANNNNLFGAQLNGAEVAVLNSTFNNNVFGNGLIVEATGNVTLTNVTAAGLSDTGNGLNGVSVLSAACVQVTGGTFANNGQYGISVMNAPLALDGTQIFANNGAGNVFQSQPGTCVIPASITGSSITLSSNSSNTSVSAGNGSNTTVGNGNNTKVKKKHGHKNKKHHQGAKRRGRGRR